MAALLLVPVLLSTLLLAAHFLRDGQWPIVLLVLCAIPLLAVRRRRAMRLVQVMLVVGALEWGRTLLALASYRLELGAPWTRMALILGAVAAFTALSALVFETRRLRRRYGVEG
jgi:hypothetical protein